MRINTYMKPQDCYQLTVLSLMEIANNMLLDVSKPKSSRHNKLMAIAEKIELIADTYEGDLPKWWIAESVKFNEALEELCNKVLTKYKQMDSPTEEATHDQTL